jgi:cellulose synthase/poly-beta-1,6-N-acetylglucosamine synthase-like glycosyltransferase
MELINILIRTSNRSLLFKRCLSSVLSQNYKNIRIIVSIDNDNNYVPDWCEIIHVKPDKELPYYYDCYCNSLKELVMEGYFFFLDDDDVLMADVLHKIKFNSPAILVQLDHIGNIVPKNENFGLGQVGMPCLIMHHTLKDLAYFTGQDHGDYHYIKEVQSKIDLTFVPMVVVKSDRRGLGN